MPMTGHRDIRVAENYAELSDKVKIDTSLQVEEHQQIEKSWFKFWVSAHSMTQKSMNRGLSRLIEL